MIMKNFINNMAPVQDGRLTKQLCGVTFVK